MDNRTWTIRLKRFLMYSVLAGCCIGLFAACGGSSLELSESQIALTDAELFDQGKTFFEQGDYQKALTYFLYIKTNRLRSSYAGVARFYAAECYFAKESYSDAEIEYESFLAFFPKEPHAPAAQYKLGVCALKQSRGPDRDQTIVYKALTEFQNVQQDYPDAAEYIKQAEEQIRATKHELARHEFLVAMFYRRENRYISSNHRLDYLVGNYPESPLAGDALFYKGLNALKLKQPEDAKTAFLQLLQNYPENQNISEAKEQLLKLGVSEATLQTLPKMESRILASPSTPAEPESKIEALPASPVESDVKPDVQSAGQPEVQPARPSPFEGYVVVIRDNNVFTNLVREDGVQKGMLLEIRRENKRIGTIRITDIQDGFSIGAIASTIPGETIQEEDTVCCPQTK